MVKKYVIRLEEVEGLWKYTVDSTIGQTPGYDEDDLTYDGAGGGSTKQTLAEALESLARMIGHIEDLSKRVDDNQGLKVEEGQ